MSWILYLVVLIIIGYVIYRYKKGTSRLSDQAIKDFTVERIKEIDEEIIRLSLKGETVSIPAFLTNLEESKAEHLGNQTYIVLIENLKKEIIKKYGLYIQPDEAFIENGEMIIWSKYPGCFEHHLQRRYKNILFPPERRFISKKEIEEAREKDELYQEKFQKKIIELESQMRSLGEIPIGQVPTLTQNIQSLMEEAASIGGEALKKISHLENIEDYLMQQVYSAIPESKEPLELVKSYSNVERIPYWAQMKRKDRPILKEEEIPTLLSEDLETISFAGYVSRAFAPDYRPNEADIRSHLEKAVIQGFSKERADQIIAAWNEKKEKLGSP